MIDRGARHLILAGRSKSIELPALDASVTYVALDIADESQLTTFLASYDGPPLRGVIHAAGVFRDESLLRLDREGLWDVLRSKVSGAWALHRATRASDLDFFVMFSSFSAITPPHGQAAYAAASAFLDALAHARRAEGLPAVSINWGAWSDVGFAATEYGAEAHKRLEAIGMKRMTPREGLAALERLFAPHVPPQMAVFPMDVRGMTALDPAIEHAPLMRELARIAPTREEPYVAKASLDALRAMDAPAQRAFLEEQVARIVASIMEIPATRLEIRTPLTQLGLDSLVAVQLKNRVQKDVGLNVPLVNALRGGSVVSLVDDLLVDLRLGSMRGDVVAVGAQQELEL
jgi:acyl carrier protein